jgi:hypothetical protein
MAQPGLFVYSLFNLNTGNLIAAIYHRAASPSTHEAANTSNLCSGRNTKGPALSSRTRTVHKEKMRQRPRARRATMQTTKWTMRGTRIGIRRVSLPLSYSSRISGTWRRALIRRGGGSRRNWMVFGMYLLSGSSSLLNGLTVTVRWVECSTTASE